MKRRKHILWEYNGDGRFAKERLSRYWKRYWRKWQARESLRFEMIYAAPVGNDPDSDGSSFHNWNDFRIWDYRTWD